MLPASVLVNDVGDLLQSKSHAEDFKKLMKI